MEQVKKMCLEDPELSALIQDHPLLIKTLESITYLSSDHIFSILTAVENEVDIIIGLYTYKRTSRNQRICSRK